MGRKSLNPKKILNFAAQLKDINATLRSDVVTIGSPTSVKMTYKYGRVVSVVLTTPSIFITPTNLGKFLYRVSTAKNYFEKPGKGNLQSYHLLQIDHQNPYA